MTKLNLKQRRYFRDLGRLLCCGVLTSSIFDWRYLGKGTSLITKKRFLSGIAQITPPPSPQFGQLVPLFSDVKDNVLARITEPSNNDYDNDVTDIIKLRS